MHSFIFQAIKNKHHKPKCNNMRSMKRALDEDLCRGSPSPFFPSQFKHYFSKIWGVTSRNGHFLICLTREGHVSENGGTPPPPQRQRAPPSHSRPDAHSQLAVRQLPGLHFGPDELQRADDGHGPHCHTNPECQGNESRGTAGMFVRTRTHIWLELQQEEGRNFPGGPRRTAGSPAAGRSRWSRWWWLGPPWPYTHGKEGFRGELHTLREEQVSLSKDMSMILKYLTT